MSEKRMRGSWEQSDDKAARSKKAIATMRRDIETAMASLLRTTAYRMFEWDLSDPRLRAMQEMSQSTAPERWLYEKGQCIAVEIGDDVHVLPAVPEGVNIYGQPLSWRVQPDAARGYLYDALLDRTWTTEDSVVIRNTSDITPDLPFVLRMCAQLADCDLSINQMELLAGTPIAFAVDESNVLTAKNIYLAMAERVPAVFVSPYAQDASPAALDLGGRLDPGIYDVYDHWMSEALSYLGIPTIEITKRAQQSVGEISSGTDKAAARRLDKLQCRKRACEKMRELFGIRIDVKATSIGMMPTLQDEGGDEDDSDAAAYRGDP